MSFVSGFIGIFGAPNVGKSTLLNRILGTKVAIVSPRPQTTRNRIIGVYHGHNVQMVFMDTPGIHKTHTALHQSMVASAIAALREVDTLLLMVEIEKARDSQIKQIIKNIRSLDKPCVLAINKIDKIKKERLLPAMEYVSTLYPFHGIVPISALNGEGIPALLEELKVHLEPGPPFFPLDMNTDQTETFLVSEIIREKIYRYTRREIPYSCAVTVDKMEERADRNLLSVSARIHVETDTQKKILIGQKGRMIKEIGRSARLDLEKRFSVHVFLDLKVRVEKNWSRDTRALRRLGY